MWPRPVGYAGYSDGVGLLGDLCGGSRCVSFSLLINLSHASPILHPLFSVLTLPYQTFPLFLLTGQNCVTHTPFFFNSCAVWRAQINSHQTRRANRREIKGAKRTIVSSSLMEEQTAVSTTPAAASSGCFDCNICLDFAAEPVVTLCGHLYCWPCIYKWLRHTNVHAGQCPVCKAVVSQESLVPLYGRGQAFKKHDLQNQNQVIPRRPQPQRETNVNQSSVPQQHEYVYPMSAPMLSPVIHSTAGGVLGGVALAVLPWLTRNGAAHIPASMFYTSPYHFVTVGRQRRQELAMEKVLHQLCIFLSVFALICLLLF